MGGDNLPSKSKRRTGKSKRTKTKSRSKSIKKPAPRSLDALDKKLRAQEKKLKELSGKVKDMERKEKVLLKALRLPKNPKYNDPGIISDIQHSIIKMEEYLLNTTNRIDNILGALKTHKEFLMRINKKVFKADAKRKMRMELDIMKNTLSILVINGIDFDSTILKEIEKIKDSLDDEKVAFSELKKRKEKLDHKFNTELKRFDLGSIYSKRKILPGYL